MYLISYFDNIDEGDWMKRKIYIVLVIALLIGTLSACNRGPQYERYSSNFFGTFDTVTQVIGYTQSEEEFSQYMSIIQEEMTELHQLYDIYNKYEGINNLKTINDNAGIEPVQVDDRIIDLILLSKEWYGLTNGKMNIAMGPVLRIWSAYREDAELNPENAAIPSMEELEAANLYTDIDKVIVDKENNTIYLEDPEMSLDVGSVAKGYAVELVSKEVQQAGFNSGIISAGGNVRTFGKPLDNIRERWGIGIQNPDESVFDDSEESSLETIFVRDQSVVSSGDYQRNYMVDGERIHHLIDPDTLMPGDHFRAISVVTEDSGIADILSTAIFLMTQEEGIALVESLDFEVHILWANKDARVEVTEGMKEIMKSHGASGADSK